MYVTLVNLTKDIFSKPSPSSILEDAKPFSIRGLYELTKPRLSLLSVFTASLGFLVHDPLKSDFSLFLALTIGTAFAAGGAAALNQWMERKEDALMSRTASRPLPAKLVSPELALCFGAFLCTAGLAILWTWTNPWATLLTFSTLFIYLAIYTPLKKVSPIAIEIGAIAGALPPLIGWVVAAGAPTMYGIILFGILFSWQLPHFMAIAWNHRRDYTKGGFQFHHSNDSSGRKIGLKSFFYSIVLTTFVFAPFFLPLNQSRPQIFYLASATLLSVYLLNASLKFLSKKDRDQNSKKLFFVTIIYLPLLLASLVIDRYL
ncbi:MAG: protoheme IX farnesyltransferase [Verrucomicrobia bacterium TMED56]|mgnify:FL=1|nr:MAG: protoheme IX farnesyltransferase [Verrucomicrobia bacterium TMED56]